jgi:diaminohydroxyphosphoribosylaminopyrimidine deaminase / 5-amino-6-(5-phosphoribosylamino)uracil reductase
MSDQDYLQLALQLAAQGTGLVSPNPLVGSIIVKDGEIIGRGYHRYDELKHAEAWALEEAGARAQGATVYVNLEPCAHDGAGKRTSPCAQSLIAAGVQRVVASMIDPNPRVSGRGFAQLRAAGIEVSVGTLEHAAQKLNEKYTKFITTGLPFVHLKTACSLDGRIATRTGDAKWITSEAARAASQNLRHEYDAILIGIGTALADDPLLTERTARPRRRPLARVVLDAQLRLPHTSQLVRTARAFPLIVFTADRDSVNRAALAECGVTIVTIEFLAGQLNLQQVLRELAQRQLTSLIVEGGATVAASFIEQRLIDKATFFIAPKIIGGREAVPAIGGTGAAYLRDALTLREIEIARHGDDLEITGYPYAE